MDWMDYFTAGRCIAFYDAKNVFCIMGTELIDKWALYRRDGRGLTRIASFGYYEAATLLNGTYDFYALILDFHHCDLIHVYMTPDIIRHNGRKR